MLNEAQTILQQAKPGYTPDQTQAQAQYRNKPWPRAIIFVDMDAFFASIEQYDNPKLRGKPLGVTNGKTGTCFITCSYEARAYGIKTGTRLKEARRLCPQVIQVPARPTRYVEISTKIMQAMQTFTPDVEVFSVDECFLDVTHCQSLLGDPFEIAKQVKEKIYQISGLRCSVGVSGDKTTAKYAAKRDKPNGLTAIPPWKSREVLKDVLTTELCGINTGIGAFLAERGVYKCGDMQKLPIGELAKRFGNPGRRVWYMAQGLDPAKVETEISAPKSIGHGKVMPPNTKDIDIIYIYLQHMSEKVAERLRQHQLEAQTFYVGLLSNQGWVSSKKLKTELPTNDGRKIMELCKYLLYRHWRGSGVYQCQVIAMDPRAANTQMDLFNHKDARRDAANQAVDHINQKYGGYTIYPAPLMKRSNMPDVIAPAWKPYGHRQFIKT